MIILLLMIVLYVIHDHCLRQEASNVELEWLIVWQNNVHMLLLFPSPFSHWLVFTRQGPKHSGLCSVISRSSPLSEFTVYIVRRGFAYWGIGVRTGALTTGTTMKWHDAKIVDPVEPYAMHNRIAIWPSILSTRRLVLGCHYTPYVAPILHQTGADGKLLDI